MASQLFPRLSIALFTLTGACTARLNVPAGSQIACKSNRDCPTGFVCRDSVQRCVDSDNLGDITAPELVSKGTVSPSVARAGSTITVTFEVNEALSEAPIVTAELRTQTVVFAPTSASPDNSYTYEYTVTGEESEGSAQIFVSLSDTAANQAKGLLLGSFSLDFQKPQLISARPAASAFRAAEPVIYTINVSETLVDGGLPALKVKRDGVVQEGFFAAPVLRTDTSFTWTKDASSVADGLYTVEIALTDDAGNESGVVNGDSFTVDSSTPVISAVNASPTLIRGEGTLTVTFDASEETPANSVVVSVGGFSMSCGEYQATSPNFTCNRAMTGTEIPSGTEASQTVLLRVTDGAGNRGEASTFVVFDFAPPDAAFAALAYLSPLGNPLGLVEAATVGTKVQVQVVATEALASSPTPTMTASFGGQTLTFATLANNEGGATFETTIPPGAPDGTYLPTVTWTDSAGNTNNAATFAAPLLRVKTSIPTLAVAQSQVTYLRSTQGNSAPETLGGNGFVIPAGPYFALAPADTLNASVSLPENTFTLLGGAAPSLVRLWGDAGLQTLLATVQANSDGTWPRATVSPFDAPALFATGVDEAGNESVTVKITSAEWVVTPNPPAFGTSPHVLQFTPQAQKSRVTNPGTLIIGENAASGRDGSAILARAQALWRERKNTSTTPAEREEHAMAYDSARDRVVVFGGSVSGAVDEVWEFDGDVWLGPFLPPVRPVARTRHAMAYDSARGVVVMFGGINSSGTPQSDVWEWDGTSWLGPYYPSLRPSARSRMAMAYDSSRGKTVLFGGVPETGIPSDQVWEWDGFAWEGPLSPSQRPSARYLHAAAYDAVRGRFVMMSGLGPTGQVVDDLWEWDGSAWFGPIAPATRPAPLYYHAMSFDGEQVMVMGGDLGSSNLTDQLWRWSGTAWQGPITPASRPSARRTHAMVYDSARKRLVTFGGRSAANFLLNDLWSYDGSVWRGPVPSPTVPGPRSGFVMAYDSARQRVVVVGGANEPGTVWEYDGAGWRGPIEPVTRPSVRDNAAMAFDSVRNRMVLVGGLGGGATRDDLWEWDGATWFGPITPATRPPLRHTHAMAFDAQRGVTVVFGGRDNSTQYDDVWEWNGSVWSGPFTPVSRPAGRGSTAMTFDASRNVTVMFGGVNLEGARFDDVWEWNGTSWAGPLQPAHRPSARADHQMVYDSGRGLALLYGGYSTTSHGDVWQWNGAQWEGPLSPSVGPSARSRHGLVYDTHRARMVMFGGFVGGDRGDLWEYDAGVERRPAVQLDVSFAAGGISRSAISQLTVRGSCGGTFSPYGPSDTGAALLGWAGAGTLLPAGSWQQLAENTSSSNQPLGATAELLWTSSSAAQAQGYFIEGPRLASFRCEAKGGSGGAVAEVGVDYLEARIKYSP